MTCEVPRYMRPTESWKRRGESSSLSAVSSKSAQAPVGKKQKVVHKDAMEKMAQKVRAKAVDRPFGKPEDKTKAKGGKKGVEKVVVEVEKVVLSVSKLPRLSSPTVAQDMCKVLPIWGGRTKASKIPKAPEGMCVVKEVPMSCKVASKAERLHTELWGGCGLLGLVPGRQVSRRGFGFGIRNVNV